MDMRTGTSNFVSTPLDVTGELNL